MKMKLEIGYLNITLDRAWWSMLWHSGHWYGIFRNLPHIIPGRWGVFLFGIEFGSRNPGDRVGVWLKNHRLWPW